MVSNYHPANPCSKAAQLMAGVHKKLAKTVAETQLRWGPGGGADYAIHIV